MGRDVDADGGERADGRRAQRDERRGERGRGGGGLFGIAKKESVK